MVNRAVVVEENVTPVRKARFRGSGSLVVSAAFRDRDRPGAPSPLVERSRVVADSAAVTGAPAKPLGGVARDVVEPPCPVSWPPLVRTVVAVWAVVVFVVLVGRPSPWWRPLWSRRDEIERPVERRTAGGFP